LNILSIPFGEISLSYKLIEKKSRRIDNLDFATLKSFSFSGFQRAFRAIVYKKQAEHLSLVI